MRKLLPALSLALAVALAACSSSDAGGGSGDGGSGGGGSGGAGGGAGDGGSGGTGGTGGAGGGAPEGPSPAGWDAEAVAPLAPDENPDPTIVEVTLEARVDVLELVAGKPAEVWTYNGSIPGPRIEANVGDTLIVHFTNRLPEPTTIHWHGVRVPADMDGSTMMQEPVEPGGTFEYRFVVPDAGTYWYHPHVRSDVQVEKGLAGALVVRDPAAPPLGEELTIVLDDVMLDADGTIAEPGAGGHMEEMMGREGNTLLVNGKTVAPVVLARNGLRQRWRLVNAANARYFRLVLTNATLVQVGNDGGLLPAPIESPDLVLAPGERAEVVLAPDGTPGTVLRLQWRDYDRGQGADRRPVDLVQVRITDLEPVVAEPLPASLADIEPLALDGTEATQRFTLGMGMVAGGMVFTINGAAWPDAAPVMATIGETQIWEVVNATAIDHPFHLHGYFFQVLDVQGVAPSQVAWKDTVNVPGGETLRFAVRFDDRPGMWMFHCHILEHAELGMMGHLMVME